MSRALGPRRVAESKLAVVAALFANLLIAVLKLVAGILAASAAMLAEAAHSFSDTGNEILLLVGMSRSARPPTERHPYGTGKAAYFWPFLVAVLLFGVAGAYSFFEGFEKLLHPAPLNDLRLSIVVLIVAFGIECASFYVGLREARHMARARGVTTLSEFLEENRDASLLTVLVEDILALVSLPIAGIALFMSWYTGNTRWDGAGSILIGLLLMGFALFLGGEVQRLLLGRGLSRRDLAKVHAVLRGEPSIERVLSVQSMYMGPQAVLLGVEMDVRDALSAAEVEDAIARVERKLVESVPALRFVYLKPRDSVRSAETAAAPPS